MDEINRKGKRSNQPKDKVKRRSNVKQNKKLSFSGKINTNHKERRKKKESANKKEVEKQYRRRRERKNEKVTREEMNHSIKRRRQTDDDEKVRSLWKEPWMRIWLIIGSAFVLALVAYTTILYGGKLIVDEDKLSISPPTTIETTDGEIIWYLYDEFRLPVSLETIPEHVQDAFVAIEDLRFYSHTGVDLRSIIRAVYRDIVARDKVEGASTITQQLRSE